MGRRDAGLVLSSSVCFRGTQALLLAPQTATREPGGLESLSATPPQKQETWKLVLIGLRVSLHIPNILRAKFRADPVKRSPPSLLLSRACLGKVKSRKKNTRLLKCCYLRATAPLKRRNYSHSTRGVCLYAQTTNNFFLRDKNASHTSKAVNNCNNKIKTSDAFFCLQNTMPFANCLLLTLVGSVFFSTS